MKNSTMRAACEEWITKWDAIELELLNLAMKGDGYDNWYIQSRIENDDGEIEYGYDGFPMWGTVWQPYDGLDADFIEQHEKEVMDLGFTIISNEEFGVWLGIDGCGYDFYTEHWLPLYRLRGLMWHDLCAIYDLGGYALYEDEQGAIHAVNITDERTREYYDRHHADGYSTGSEQ